MPRIDDTIDTLSGAHWFNTMDLASGYWQVEMAEEDKEKTAFVTKKGLFQFSVMPFGLCNAPSTFERLIELVLRGLTWDRCLVYIDDILVYGKTFEATLENLRAVFARIKDSGLKLKPSKCSLFQKEVHFLGYVVSRDGVSCDETKVDAVRNWERPKSVKEVRSFLGLASYYRKFIKNFSTIAAPLTALTRKGARFAWNEECELAFQCLKDMLTNSPVLSYPTKDGPFILDTDASNYGLGAVLSQVQNGEEKVVAYASRTLSKSQRSYCTTYKELLAVRLFVEHFRCYLYLTEFTVRTDHASLTWLKNFDNPEGMVLRWIAYLDTFNIKWEHRKGLLHGNADGLSRQPPPKRKCKYKECPDCGISEEEFPCECFVLRSEPLGCFQTKDGKATKKSLQDRAAECFDNWLGQWSKEDMRTWQHEDVVLEQVIKWKEESGERPRFKDITDSDQDVKTLWMMWSELHVTDGVLYRHKYTGSHLNPIKQLVAPMKLRDLIFDQLHATRLGGHLGVTKTLEKIKLRFYWAGCKRDVKLWCKNCACCAQKSGVRTRASMQHTPVGIPMQKIAMDITGPFPISENGNAYLLVISDYFTRWVEAYPIPDKTASTVADKYVSEFVTRYGIAEQIHTDQGREFMSSLFTEMCKLLEIEQTRTTPYRPMSDGLIERLNRTLQQMLSAFVLENRHTWEDHLPYVLMAYRSTIQETTGCSPNLLMFGREIMLPIDLLAGTCPVEQEKCVTEYVAWLQSSLKKAFAYAKEKMKKGVQRQKYNYNKKSRNITFEPGDLVLVFNVPQSQLKLGKPWDGPVQVISKLSEVTYRIQRDVNAKPKVVHVNHLKKYHAPAPHRLWPLPISTETTSL